MALQIQVCENITVLNKKENCLYIALSDLDGSFTRDSLLEYAKKIRKIPPDSRWTVFTYPRIYYIDALLQSGSEIAK